MNDLWVIHELSLNYPWAIHGSSMPNWYWHPWISIEYQWLVHGSFIDNPLAPKDFHGLPKTGPIRSRGTARPYYMNAYLKGACKKDMGGGTSFLERLWTSCEGALINNRRGEGDHRKRGCNLKKWIILAVQHAIRMCNSLPIGMIWHHLQKLAKISGDYKWDVLTFAKSGGHFTRCFEGQVHQVLYLCNEQPRATREIFLAMDRVLYHIRIRTLYP